MCVEGMIENGRHDLESEKLEDRRLIRRFTDQLPGASDLERATKAAQEKRDEDAEAEHRVRMRRLYDEPLEHSSYVTVIFWLPQLVNLRSPAVTRTLKQQKLQV